MNSLQAAELAAVVESALTRAGLTLATDDTPITPNGWTASGVGVNPAEVDGEHVVMLTWGTADGEPGETVGIMLAAVAEVLRTHGFQVQQHPAGRARLVAGRSE